MNRIATTSLAFALGAAAGCLSATAGTAAPKLETLLRAELEVAPGIEVIVSRVEIPPGQQLPKHYHPGEEFVYVINGNAVIVQDGQADVSLGPGEVIKIPYKQAHTGKTADKAATAVVFRVHKKGEPERVPVE